jgi:hypothetical protein
VDQKPIGPIIDLPGRALLVLGSTKANIQYVLILSVVSAACAGADFNRIAMLDDLKYCERGR